MDVDQDEALTADLYSSNTTLFIVIMMIIVITITIAITITIMIVIVIVIMIVIIIIIIIIMIIIMMIIIIIIIRRIHGASKVTVIPIVIGALGSVSKRAKTCMV